MKSKLIKRCLCSKASTSNKTLNEFNFDSMYFARNMLNLLTMKQLPSSKEIELKDNEITNEINSICKDIEDPFALINDDMEVIKNVTFNNILTTQNDLLKEIAEYNLKLKGKNFRSWIIMLLSRALFSANPQSKFVKFEDTKEYHESTVLASCVEIWHNATLMQDDIIDKAETRRSKVAVYKLYSRSKSVFASNFIISRASRSLAMLDTPYLSQIFSTILYNLVHGELIQAKSSEDKFDINVSIPNYISKTYYKTASMISQACRGVAIIHGLNEEKQK